jgi:hypothetical protein
LWPRNTTSFRANQEHDCLCAEINDRCRALRQREIAF